MEGVSFYTISFEIIKAEFLCKQMFYLNISRLFWYIFYENPSANSSSFLMVFDRTLRMIKLYSKTGFLRSAHW